MEFEWDEAKNRSNLRKHGLDFADAATAFDGPPLVAPDEEYGKSGFALKGKWPLSYGTSKKTKAPVADGLETR